MSSILNISLRRVVNAMVFVAAALTGLLVSCVQIEQNNEGTGYISFDPLSVDVAIEGLELTKASVPPGKVPKAGDFTYTIVGKTDGRTYYSAQGLPADPIPLPVGTYKVDAVYGANEFNQAYYTASVDNVQIEVDKTININFGEITLDNAMVAVTLLDLSSHMEEVSYITVSDGKTSIDVESGKYYFAPVGPSVTVSFGGTNKLGEKKDFSVNLGVLEPKHAYKVECDLELPSFKFADQSSGAIAGRLYLTSLAKLDGGLDASKVEYQVSSDGGSSWKQAVLAAKDGYWVISRTKDGNALASDGTSYQIRAVYGGLVAGPWTFTPSMPVNTLTGVSIAHTYEERSFAGLKSELKVLIGSSAEVSGTDIVYPDKVDSLISSKGSRGAELVNGSGNVVRTLSDKETGSMTKTGDWVYLPKGSYTLKPYFQIGDDKVYLSSLSASSPAPAFTVTAYAETSYSRYLSGSLELANTSGTAEKIMGIRGIVSISDEVLSNNADLISESEVTLKYGDSSMLSSGTAVTTSVWYPNTVATKEKDTDNWELTGLSWGSHTISASFTFDGVAAKSSTDSTSTVSTLQCHITGLPHEVSFYKNTTITGWTFSNFENPGGATPSTSYIAFKPTDAYAKSPAFILPESVSVQVIVPYAIYSSVILWSGYNKYSPTVYVDTISESTTPSKNGTSFSCGETSNDPSPDDRFNNKELEKTLDINHNCISIYIYGEKHRSTSIDRTLISSCTIKYR